MRKVVICGCLSISGLYLAFSCVKSLVKAISIYDKSKEINYLLSNIEKSSSKSNLKYLKNMFIQGIPKQNKKIVSIYPEHAKNFFFIHRMNLRVRQNHFPKGELLYLAPSFYLQTKKHQIDINTLNGFPYCESAQKFIDYQALTPSEDILFQLNLISRSVIAGMKYDDELIVGGNFIYDEIEGRLRCYKIKQIIQPGEFSLFKIGYVLKQLFFFSLKALSMIIILRMLYSEIKQNLAQHQNREFKAQISKTKNSLICSQCKKNLANVIIKPCFHLDCCIQCVEQNQILQCSVCNKNIEDMIKIFNQ